MPSNFVDLKQAATMLGVTPDELVEMRSQGEIFGFRDGSSWKFKMDELERVAQERGVELSAGPGEDDAGDGDDLSLQEDSELDLSKPLFGDSGDLADDEADGSSIGELMASDDIDLDAEDSADSLLVSDDAPLVSESGGGSTIIGDTPNPESDLTLAVDDDDDDVLGSDPTLAGAASGGSSILGGELDPAAADAGGSDVRLVASGDGSDVTVVPDSDELLVGPDGSGIAQNKSDSDGLELGTADDDDLELSAGAGTGDLDPTDDSGGELEVSTGAGTGDLELDDSDDDALELSAASGTGDLELDLDSGNLDLDDDLGDDDDLVLGDSGAGSDVTLGTGDTGINLTSASDSGLSLEEEPIELGSASSLELPEEDVISLEDAADPDAATQLKQDEEFLLSPGDAMDDEDSGSQVIALEESAAFDQDAATLLGDDAFSGGLQEQVQQPMQPAPMEAPGAMAAGAMAPAGVPGAAMAGAPAPEAPREAPYSIWNVLALMLITGVLGLSGMLMMDVVRNMWSWDGASGGSISTGITEGLISALKLK